MKRVLAVVLFALTMLFAGGCGSKTYWRAEPVVTSEVRIAPQEVYLSKNRLFVRVTVVNLTQETVIVSRDLVTLQLGGGRVVSRSSGMTTQHQAYSLNPGASRAVYIDFKDDELMDAVNSANVVWKGAIRAGSREIEVPPTPVQRQ
jgi:hypothetical protein